MAEIVLVHGIAQEPLAAPALETAWLSDLARGIRSAGFAELAARAPAVTAAMACYDDLFLVPGRLGLHPGELAMAEQEFAARLALAWLASAARTGSAADRPAARTELELAAGIELRTAQGIGSTMRTAVAGLAQLRWFAPQCAVSAQRTVCRALTQISRYVADEELRTAAVSRVTGLIGADTRVVVGHSLGAVLAYDAVCTLRQPLPLLVTLGSPLGLQGFGSDRSRTRPPRLPSSVDRWVNLADRDDLVAADPRLELLFLGNGPGPQLEADYTADRGARPDSAAFYLSRPETGRPIALALSGVGLESSR